MDPKAILTIGGFCSIGPSCQIYIGTASRHFVDFITTFPLTIVFGPTPSFEPSRVTQGDLSVRIGSDVWIGVESIIMAGVHVGHGAVIAARSVVTNDVPPYAVVGGAPAKVLKYRFGERLIKRLLEVSWWDWPDRLIKDNLPCFYTQDIDVALKRLEKVAEQLRQESVVS
jgi:acetyltransferase-like isoleucine patch superfamily enzyme